MNDVFEFISLPTYKIKNVTPKNTRPCAPMSEEVIFMSFAFEKVYFLLTEIVANHLDAS